MGKQEIIEKMEIKKMKMKYDELPYRVGGLLYTPALNDKIAGKIVSGEIKALTSLVFCLEDSIMDEKLEQAEKQLIKTLSELETVTHGLPLLFVRVRDPEHMARVHKLLGAHEQMLTGYVLPKFDDKNADDYIALIREYNIMRENVLYIMPILESRTVADVTKRITVMDGLKHRLDTVREYVLNVRVGGNDLSNMFGLRRSMEQTIYDIGVIRDILVDVVSIFAKDYVVSGPVWEYFGDDTDGRWAAGLRRETELDMINGFFGKTAIHPSQLPVIYDSLKVSLNDYEDARAIADWKSDSLAVSKGAGGNRMNEVKCHLKWARQILIRARVYGIKE